MFGIVENFYKCCKDCEKRHEACHASCDFYKNQKKEYEELKAKVESVRRQDKVINQPTKWDRRRKKRES